MSDARHESGGPAVRKQGLAPQVTGGHMQGKREQNFGSVFAGEVEAHASAKPEPVEVKKTPIDIKIDKFGALIGAKADEELSRSRGASSSVDNDRPALNLGGKYEHDEESLASERRQSERDLRARTAR